MPLLLAALLALSAPRREAGTVTVEREGDRPDSPADLPQEIFMFSSDPRTAVSLSVADCIRLTLGVSPDLIGARLTQESARANVTRQLDAFVPSLRSSFGYQEGMVAGATVGGTSPGRDYVTTGSISLAAGAPTGTTVTTTLELSGRSNNLAAETFGRVSTAKLRAEVTQSLIRRIGLHVDLAEYLAARHGRRAAELRVDAVLELVIQQVAFTYFDLMAAAEVLKVRREGRKLALELFEMTRKRIASGSAAPYEIFQAQSTLAARYNQELSAEQALIAAEERMYQLFHARIRDDGKISSNNLMILVEQPTASFAGEPLEQLLERARRQRPDYLATYEEVAGTARQRHAAFRRMLPELSATGFVEVLGQAGKLSRSQALLADAGQLNLDPRLLGGLPEAFGNFGREFTNTGVMVHLTLPLLFGAERFSYRVASANAERAVLQRHVTEQAIESDVALAVAQQGRSVKRIAMARLSLQAARQNLSAEMKKSKLGTSSNFDVLRVQEEVINALQSVAEAQADLGRASARLRFAVGEGRTYLSPEAAPLQ